MDVTNIELYEALKKTLNEDAARMIAEVIPRGADVATQRDIAGVERRIDQVEAGITRRIDQLESRMLRFAFTLFIPLWAGVFGALVALFLRV